MIQFPTVYLTGINSSKALTYGWWQGWRQSQIQAAQAEPRCGVLALSSKPGLFPTVREER